MPAPAPPPDMVKQPHTLPYFQLTLWLFLMASCTQGPGSVLESRGTPLEENNPWRGAVAFLIGAHSSCSGSVLEDHPQAILTAAHCVQGEERIWVSFPGDDQKGTPPLETTRWHTHPGYQLYSQGAPTSLKNWLSFYDLAVVHLPQEAPRLPQTLRSRPYYGTISGERPFFVVSMGADAPVLDKNFVQPHTPPQPPHPQIEPPLPQPHHPTTSTPLPLARISHHGLIDTLFGDMAYMVKFVLFPYFHQVVCPGDSGGPVLLPPNEDDGGAGAQVAVVSASGNHKGGWLCGKGHSYFSNAVALAPHRWWLEWALAQTQGRSHAQTALLPPATSLSHLVIECGAPLGAGGAQRVVIYLEARGLAQAQWGSSALPGEMVAQAHARWHVLDHQHVVLDIGPWEVFSPLSPTFPRGPLVMKFMARPNWNLPLHPAQWWESPAADAPFHPFQCYVAQGPRFLDFVGSAVGAGSP